MTAAYCWATIGVSGDRTCPELRIHVHCRNCPVVRAAAATVLDRPAPEGYASHWTDALAPTLEREGPTTSVVAFRLGDEWLAVDTAAVAEITELRPIRRVAHRTHSLLSGLVNIRGQLHLCMALDALLEMPRRTRAPGVDAPPRGRLVVLQSGAESWAFSVDEVHGVIRFPSLSLTPPPASLPPPLLAVTRGTFPWDERRVGYLDAVPLLAALRRAIT